MLILFTIQCNNLRETKDNSKETLITFLRDTINPLLINQQTTEARLLLDSVYPYAAKSSHPVFLYWLLCKSALSILEKELDSSKYYARAADTIAKENKNSIKERHRIVSQLAQIFFLEKKLDSAIYFGQEAYHLATTTDTPALPLINYRLAEIYSAIGDKEATRKHLFEGYEQAKFVPLLRSGLAVAIAKFYDDINLTDSAISFLKSIEGDSILYSKESMAIRLENTGVLLLRKNRPWEGLQYLMRAMPLNLEMGTYNALSMFNIAQAYSQMKQLDKSNRYLDSAMHKALSEKDNKVMRQIWNQRAKNHFSAHNFLAGYSALDSAYNLFQVEQDSSIARYARELGVQYATKDKEKRIDDLNKANEATRQITNQQRIAIVAMIVALLSLGGAATLLYRRRKMKMIVREVSLRQQLLRSQIDSHFLFNCLSELQSLIEKRITETTVNYLQHLSVLIRMGLQNARYPFASLEDEIVALKSYLTLEQINLPQVFDYVIHISDDTELDGVTVPPMLLQPVVENAIRHGFFGIDYKGTIDIIIKLAMNHLHCTIEDNGSGLKHAGEKGKKGSLGIKIITERLEILGKQTRQPASITLIDKALVNNGTGTKVVLQIPVKW